jgi:ABC-type Mn2+/Zn2+ transport system ATPase subunit
VRVGIRFEGITASLGGRLVLRDVSFTVPAGVRTALVGPNGGGKTTLVRVLVGALAAESGRIVFVDESGREVPRPRVGYLSQRSTLSAQAPVSGVDLVALSLDPRPGFGRRDEARREARAALLRAGLPGETLDRPVGKLSGGQRQRVLLARALAGGPALLVLDEPDTALDAKGLMTLRRVIAEESGAGRTILFASHDTDSMGGADALFRVDGVVTEEPLKAAR